MNCYPYASIIFGKLHDPQLKRCSQKHEVKARLHLRVWHETVESIPRFIRRVLHQRQHMLLRRAVRRAAGVALQLIQITRRATHLLNHTLTNTRHDLKRCTPLLHLMIGSFTGCFLDFLGYSVWIGRISVTGSSGVMWSSPKMAAC